MLSNCRSVRIAYATLTVIVTTAYGCILNIYCHCYFCLDDVMEQCNALNDSIKSEAEKQTTKVVSITPIQIQKMAKIKFIMTTVKVEIIGKTSIYLLAHELNLQCIGEISLFSGRVSTYVVMKEKLKGMKLRVASHLFDEMSERNHFQAVHTYIIFQSNFSLILVENELVVPVWDQWICSGDVQALSVIVEKHDFSLEVPEVQQMNLVIEVALDIGVNGRNKTCFPSLHYHGMNMALFVGNIILLHTDFSGLIEENVPVPIQK
ncbi:hypothetical protein RDI58_007491 [Solanum bulbocastanum]|uniref:Uncharacterized protein n=1 Tax=Solanum bulbocastanum TaxID=147425 RepID=A0AAN8YM69_SOLBU